MKKKDKAIIVIQQLKADYPDAHCELIHDGPFQLLIATILSAQCTDVMVNKVTPILFAKFPTPETLAKARVTSIEKIVKPTGFYKNKAKNIKSCAQRLVEEFSGEIPKTIEQLTSLAGVGRKTANVVLNTAFGWPTIAVDTHIFRVSNRTKLAMGKDVVAVEQKLEKVIPKEFKVDVHHWLILHGRYVCTARKPKCGSCIIEDLCEFKDKTE